MIELTALQRKVYLSATCVGSNGFLEDVADEGLIRIGKLGYMDREYFLDQYLENGINGINKLPTKRIRDFDGIFQPKGRYNA